MRKVLRLLTLWEGSTFHKQFFNWKFNFLVQISVGKKISQLLTHINLHLMSSCSNHIFDRVLRNLNSLQAWSGCLTETLSHFTFKKDFKKKKKKGSCSHQRLKNWARLVHLFILFKQNCKNSLSPRTYLSETFISVAVH